MSSFNTILNENRQFIVKVKVIKPSELQEYKKGKAQKLFFKAKPKRALIDTGAAKSCISQEYAEELGLFPISKANIITASNVCQVDEYKVDIAIHVEIATIKPVKKEDGETSTEQVVIGEENWAHVQHKVNSLPSIGEDRGFDVILGMDILSKMHITIFNKQIIMSF